VYSMRRIVFTFGLIALAATSARADYAVLRSGERLHITSYERTGGSIRLMIDGGAIELPAENIVSFEPEDVFPANAPAHGGTGKLIDIIHAAAARHGVDEKLIASVIAAESNFNPRAVSRKQAQGLMQLLPATSARFSVKDAFDPAQNIEAGTRYLKQLLEQYRGNLVLTLAAYNAGPELVARYGGVPPIAETRAYIRRVTERYSSLSAIDSASAR
jgi:soluble lytic murein transglycosylase-like protein